MIDTLYSQFKRWSEKGSVYIISDTHFDDPDRLYMGYKISEDEQIKYIKKYCSKNDTLIHLGDVGNPEYMKYIKSYKVLIMGNHDETTSKFKDYFDEIYTGPLIIAEKLIISHEPVFMKSCTTGNNIIFNIHGHDHSGSFIDSNHLNLAQNIYGYYPLHLQNWIRTGALKNVKSIHRETIDTATKKKRKVK